jgi:hypothetical protein
MHEIKINDRITAVLEYDELCQGPEEFGMLGKIYYFNRSRYRLGTVPVSSDNLDEITLKIKQGELIGLPVYAYVHSGVALATTPFSCSFDSGLSGFIACSHEDVANWYGAEMPKEEILEVLRNEVEEFSKFLAGDVYVIKILVDGEEKDVIGGHYGFDYAVTCAKELAQEYVKFHEKVVKVVLKTGVGEKEVKLDDASITKLEACVDFAAKVGGVIELYGDSSEPLPGWSWRITHQGVKLAGIMLVESNNIEIKKFRKMMYDGDVEGFEKLEDGTYAELD